MPISSTCSASQRLPLQLNILAAATDLRRRAVLLVDSPASDWTDAGAAKPATDSSSMRSPSSSRITRRAPKAAVRYANPLKNMQVEVSALLSHRRLYAQRTQPRRLGTQPGLRPYSTRVQGWPSGSRMAERLAQPTGCQLPADRFLSPGGLSGVPGLRGGSVVERLQVCPGASAGGIHRGIVVRDSVGRVRGGATRAVVPTAVEHQVVHARSFRQGGVPGFDPQQAYLVKCDRNNHTVGSTMGSSTYRRVCTLKPAEFVAPDQQLPDRCYLSAQ